MQGLVHQLQFRVTAGFQCVQFRFPRVQAVLPFPVDPDCQGQAEQHGFQGRAQFHAVGGNKAVGNPAVFVGGRDRAAEGQCRPGQGVVHGLGVAPEPLQGADKGQQQRAWDHQGNAQAHTGVVIDEQVGRRHGQVQGQHCQYQAIHFRADLFKP